MPIFVCVGEVAGAERDKGSTVEEERTKASLILTKKKKKRLKRQGHLVSNETIYEWQRKKKKDDKGFK